MLYIANITITVLFISPILYLLLTIEFTCLNIFIAQKIGNDTIEAPFGILVMSNERQNKLRVKPIVEREIGFLLDFYRY